jgi:peptidoglycan hydrolase-like protein with peptidoglycan-binding domain
MNMNLLNALLLYMSLLTAGSMQQLPELTPPPAPFVTIAPETVATVAPIVTAAPSQTAVVVPPAAGQTALPTQTPVIKTTVAMGDRGDNVRKLQKRLIELRYLSKGEDDGIFGQKTKRAVERFQNYNNLKVDGVAGPKTLDKLYNDPKVVVGPVDIDTQPKTTQTPKPAVTVQVPVVYLDEQGKELARQNLFFQQGVTTMHSNNASVPEGYVIISPASVKVTVSQDGKASPEQVIFIYKAPAPVTEAPTEVPTEKPTEVPTEKPTEQPTEKPTEVPTEKPTEVPTEKPTEVPTEEPTEAPATEVPATEVPATEAPATEVPATEAPATETPAPGMPANAYYIPAFQSAKIARSYDVYLGPGPDYRKAGVVGGGACRWYGTEGQWALMGYQASDGAYHVGYVEKAALPAEITVAELELMDLKATLTDKAYLTDDPVLKAATLFSIEKGTQVTVLGVFTDNDRYVLIETSYNNKPVRGFINKSSLGW